MIPVCMKMALLCSVMATACSVMASVRSVMASVFRRLVSLFSKLALMCSHKTPVRFFYGACAQFLRSLMLNFYWSSAQVNAVLYLPRHQLHRAVAMVVQTRH